MIGYINNDSITTDANNFAIQFVSDTYLPKDAMTIKLCAEENGVSPVFSLNIPTLNHVYYDPNLQDENLFNRESDTETVKKIDNSAQLSSIDEYKVSLKTPEIKPPKDDTEIVYKMSIEPSNTVLNVEDDTLTWNLYRQRVSVSTTGKEILGNKQLVSKIYAQGTNSQDGQETKGSQETQNSQEIYPILQFKVNDKIYSNPKTDENDHNADMYDATNQKFGVKFDYNPGQHKVKIGFAGYTTDTIKNPNDKIHNNKKVTYRSAEVEFTVDMYWKIANTVNFAQIYKKINEDKEIKSISIHTTDKFQNYMNTIRGTTPTDTNNYMHFFIKNMVLHEAEHIPLFHPNVRMKIYSKAADGSDTNVEAVGIRKIGAIIEYK